MMKMYTNLKAIMTIKTMVMSICYKKDGLHEEVDNEKKAMVLTYSSLFRKGQCEDP